MTVCTTGRPNEAGADAPEQWLTPRDEILASESFKKLLLVSGGGLAGGGWPGGCVRLACAQTACSARRTRTPCSGRGSTAPDSQVCVERHLCIPRIYQGTGVGWRRGLEDTKLCFPCGNRLLVSEEAKLNQVSPLSPPPHPLQLWPCSAAEAEAGSHGIINNKMVSNVRTVPNHASTFRILKVVITPLNEPCTHLIHVGTKESGSHTVPRFTVHPVSGLHQLEICSSLDTEKKFLEETIGLTHSGAAQGRGKGAGRV